MPRIVHHHEPRLVDLAGAEHSRLDAVALAITTLKEAKHDLFVLGRDAAARARGVNCR